MIYFSVKSKSFFEKKHFLPVVPVFNVKKSNPAETGGGSGNSKPAPPPPVILFLSTRLYSASLSFTNPFRNGKRRESAFLTGERTFRKKEHFFSGEL